jgi:hypothetical protein
MHGSNASNLFVLLSLSQTSKRCVFLIISYVFSSTKLENKRAEQPGSGVGGEAAQTMYTRVSKCKNDKIKGKEKKGSRSQIEREIN